jgi:hypothetical protein
MTNQKSFPVRYMVVSTWYGYKVVDTLSPERKTVKKFIGCLRDCAVLDAHFYALVKNENEGYSYG